MGDKLGKGEKPNKIKALRKRRERGKGKGVEEVERGGRRWEEVGGGGRRWEEVGGGGRRWERKNFILQFKA